MVLLFQSTKDSFDHSINMLHDALANTRIERKENMKQLNA